MLVYNIYMADEMQKRVLFITDFYYPHWTGLSKSIYNLIQSIKDDFQITVLTVQHDKKLKRVETQGNVHIIREPYLFTISRSKYSAKMIFKFLSIAGGFDVVFVNSPCANILFVSLITKLFNKKLLIFHQGDLILPKSMTNLILEKIFDLCSFTAFSLADKVATYTRDYAEHSRMIRPFLNKFHPLLLPVSIVKFTKNPEKSNGEKILFGFAGRFVEEKGFDVLFDAIPLIKKELPHARFAFAGETEMEYERFFHKNIDKFNKVKDQVILMGLLDEKKLGEFYRSVDFMIVPSRSDCFNLVQAEAMLYGTPCLVSDIPGLRYLVKQTGFGLVFNKEDPESLAEACIEAVKKQKMFTKSYEKLVSLLSTEKLRGNIQNFFN